MSTTPTVFVIDDDPAIRDSVSLLLESANLVTEGYASAQAFMDAYRPERPGCLVLDVRMPDMSGLELQESLAQREINLPIVFITGHGDVAMSVKAMKAGAADFLEKPFDDQSLLECVLRALARDARTRQVDSKRSQAAARYARLTEREQQVMTFVVTGQSNKHIAARLRVSHRTVEVHRSRLMSKMEARSLPDLVAMADACGLQPPQA